MYLLSFVHFSPFKVSFSHACVLRPSTCTLSFLSLAFRRWKKILSPSLPCLQVHKKRSRSAPGYHVYVISAFTTSTAAEAQERASQSTQLSRRFLEGKTWRIATAAASAAEAAGGGVRAALRKQEYGLQGSECARAISYEVAEFNPREVGLLRK